MGAFRRLWGWVQGNRFLRWLGANLDPLLAGILAAVFLVLSALDALENDALFQAIAGLLVVFAIALFRERSERDRAMRRVEHAVADLRAGTAWEVVHARFHWTIQTVEGDRARATNQKRLRILGNQVLSVFEFYNPGGTLGKTTYRGAANDGPMQTLPEMHPHFPGPHARSYRIISLEDMLEPGDRFYLESERDLRDCFLEEREFVRVEADVPTRNIEMAVTWPAGRPLKTLQVERDGREVEKIAIGEGVQTLESGGQYFERAFTSPRVGEEIIFVWTW